MWMWKEQILITGESGREYDYIGSISSDRDTLPKNR